MKKALLIAAISVATIGLTACQQTAQVKKGMYEASYDSAIAAAKSANKQAKAAGNEWRDTGKLIKQAEGLAAKGKFWEARPVALQAEAQARIAIQQAKESENAGNPGYLYQ